MPVIEIRLGDITKLPSDAIVNSANSSLLAGGGVCGAIHRVAGKELERDCRAIGGCPTGGAVVTPGYGLPAKWVIHAVGPRWSDGRHGEQDLLRRCYESILSSADEVGAVEITVPSISTGIYRFPVELAAEIAISTIASSTTRLKKVIFVCFDKTTLEAYEAALAKTR